MKKNLLINLMGIILWKERGVLKGKNCIWE
jgi:hypothetical protein